MALPTPIVAAVDCSTISPLTCCKKDEVEVVVVVVGGGGGGGCNAAVYKSLIRCGAEEKPMARCRAARIIRTKHRRAAVCGQSIVIVRIQQESTYEEVVVLVLVLVVEVLLLLFELLLLCLPNCDSSNSQTAHLLEHRMYSTTKDVHLFQTAGG